jgi:radical SAM superfamily enzyme YgiQ (UPF0313 family)
MVEVPIGLLSISAYLKKFEDVKVDIVDFEPIIMRLPEFNYSSFKELYKNVLTLGPKDYDIVGVSCLYSPVMNNAIDLGNVIRELLPQATIVGGGNFVLRYKEIFSETTAFDGLCFGEGEKPLLRLIQAENPLKELANDPCWITAEKAQERIEASDKSFIIDEDFAGYINDYIEDIDEIPQYDYDILGLSLYYGLSQSNVIDYDEQKTTNHLLYMASRGCPQKCSFCSGEIFHGQGYRMHSVERIKQDILHLRDYHNMEKIVFADDTLTIRKKQTKEILRFLNKEKLPYAMCAGFPLQGIDSEILDLVQEGNISYLILSIESGCPKTLKHMHKPITPQLGKDLVHQCRERGIKSEVLFLMGLPTETKEDMIESREYMKTLDPTWVKICAFYPSYGSEDYQIGIQKGHITASSWDWRKPVLETEAFTSQWLSDFIYETNLEINYVLNSDMRLGDYKSALSRFENVLSICYDHAFAYYFAAKCCKALGLEEKYEKYKVAFYKYKNDFWKKYFILFKLEDL